MSLENKLYKNCASHICCCIPAKLAAKFVSIIWFCASLALVVHAVLSLWYRDNLDKIDTLIFELLLIYGVVSFLVTTFLIAGVFGNKYRLVNMHKVRTFFYNSPFLFSGKTDQCFLG